MKPAPNLEESGGQVSTITLADGKRLRHAIFEPAGADCQGALLFLSGYSEFMEKNLETVLEWQECGYKVLTFDWPGQGLSGRFLEVRQKGHVPNFQYHLDAVAQLVAKSGFRDWPGRHLIMGHSMGGHLALRFAHDHPRDFERLIAIAPMIDIHVRGLPRGLAAVMVRTLAGLGLRTQFLFGTGARLPEQQIFQDNPLTSDQDRFDRLLAYMRREPDIIVGGPTFGWVSAALNSIAELSDAAYAGTIGLPVLILSAEADSIVDNPAQYRLAELLSDCRLHSLIGARHEILCESDDIRAQFWEHVDDFLGDG